MILPTWEEIDEKINNKETLSPIEQFIYDEMPMETDDPTFMKRLNAALDYTISQNALHDITKDTFAILRRLVAHANTGVSLSCIHPIIDDARTLLRQQQRYTPCSVCEKCEYDYASIVCLGCKMWPLND